MSRGPESKLTRKILDALRELESSWWVKIPGGPFLGNIPDILGCYRGRFVAIEVKHPHTSHGVTPGQQATIDKINAAGGTADVAYSVEEAMGIARRAA